MNSSSASTLGKMTTVCSHVSLLSTPSSMKLLSRGALAVGGERRRRAPRQAAGAVDVRAGNAAQHAGDRAGQVDEIAAVERQRLDLLVADRRAQLGRRGLDERRLRLRCVTDSVIAPTSSLRSMRARWSTPSSMFDSASVLNPATSAVTV